MSDVAQTFVSASRRLLMSEYLPKIERCLERLGDEEVWWRPNDASNSIGNLLLHLCGNVRQWIVGGVGRREFERDRQQEFDERGPLPKHDLLARIKGVLAEAEAVIGGVHGESLLSRRQIQGYDVTVLEAIYHVVEHFGMHTGQIIMLTKMRMGEDLRLWRPPHPASP